MRHTLFEGFIALFVFVAFVLTIGTICWSVWWNVNNKCVSSHVETHHCTYCGAYNSDGTCLVWVNNLCTSSVCDEWVER